MSAKEILQIETTQLKILNRYIKEQPIKLGKLAKEFGVKIKIAILGNNISGQITKEDGLYIIRVNRYEAYERQRFTIAHELGHFLLHKEIIDKQNGIKDNVLYRSGNPEIIEFQANRIAADILMPLDQVRNIRDKYNKKFEEKDVLEILAAHFRVSKSAMKIRLSDLA